MLLDRKIYKGKKIFCFFELFKYVPIYSAC